MCIRVIKNKISHRVDRILHGSLKPFNWGWFKFSKCILGVFLYALAVNLFVVPNHLYTGGILGLSQVIRTALVSTFNIDLGFDISSIIYYAINLPLLLLAYKRISKTFFIRTIFTVTLCSLFLAVIPIPNQPIIDEFLASVLLGGIIAGQGIGMILSTGSSSGGTDIIGIVINRKKDRISVGAIGLVFNLFVYGICGIYYGIEIMVYSMIFSVFESMIIDSNNMQNIKSIAIIFTKENPEKLINFINYELNRGTTYWEAIGGYTNTKTYIVYTVLSKYERMRLERHMKELDDKAFMVSDDGALVKGEFGKYIL